MLNDALERARHLNSPLGVFDSGVGGLTVLKVLRQMLPDQDFIYLGDTARVPYGRKPREMVENFAYGISHFLERCGVEGVVMACNTAASAALPRLRDELNVPLWDVIAPGVEAARRITQSGQVGVIATKGTIQNRAYQSRLEALGLSAWGQACPMFVPLVEENLIDSVEAELMARYYLQDHPPMDTLILGCTHYPMLKAVISRAVGENVQLVDSAEVTAEQVSREFKPRTAGKGRVLHFVTGDPLAYEHTAKVIGGVDGQIMWLEVSVLAGFQKPLVSLES